MAVRPLGIVVAPLTIAVLLMGCASGPTVLSSTADNIAIEFPSKTTVSSTIKLANKGCTKHGKIAEFDSVDATASPKTRVAKYRCVPPDGSVDPQ